MGRILSAIALLLLMVSCKSSSNIITSKEEAIKKGIYTYNAKTFEKDVASAKEKAKTTWAKNEKKKTKKNNSKNESELAEQMVSTAMDYLGVSYRGGGTSRDGMDCSGLVTAVYNAFDMALPRSSSDMAKVGEVINTENIQKGDLIFFKTNGKNVINHVGIVTEVLENEIKFIHASTSSGVIVSSTKEPYFERTFAQANRIVN